MDYIIWSMLYVPYNMVQIIWTKFYKPCNMAHLIYDSIPTQYRFEHRWVSVTPCQIQVTFRSTGGSGSSLSTLESEVIPKKHRFRVGLGILISLAGFHFQH